MKKRALILAATVLLLLFLPGCKKEYIMSDQQAILFQFEYINYAWGYQHHGFFIDNEGNVLTYTNPEEWNFQDNDLSISESEIAENINKCIKTPQSISKEELQKYTAYISNIASSKVTALKNVAADAGSSEYICYQYSESSGIYKGSLIKMEGDFTSENLNYYSKKVVSWLKDIRMSIPIE